ncbi:MAG: M28 family peptidase [Anaerolineae bacterium]|nr:M28 family peptidase [Anaerolineae bacterium]
MPDLDDYTQQALDHICYLSERIGARGSCTPAERQAAEYAAEQMRAADARNVRIEPYWGVPSTYRPYVLAFATALLGALVVWLVRERWMMAVAALLNALGAWGMFAESDLSASWMRRLLPRAASRNAVGVLSPGGEVGRRAVLCAHLDTHRTPIFYSSTTWYLVFALLVGGSFVSMAIAALAYAMGALFDWSWVRWIGLVAAAIQFFALVLCLQADLTPFTAGANDNASGVGVALAVAQRLAAEPLAHTEVWLALTGCEEVGAYGAAAFLDAHAAELGPDAVYIILDQVGCGRVRYLTKDGLILKRKTHPRALALARRAAYELPRLKIHGQAGLAYTDALVATKRGLLALTLNALPSPLTNDNLHWHRASDTLAHIDPGALADTHAVVWQLLQQLDNA